MHEINVLWRTYSGFLCWLQYSDCQDKFQKNSEEQVLGFSWTITFNLVLTFSPFCQDISCSRTSHPFISGLLLNFLCLRRNWGLNQQATKPQAAPDCQASTLHVSIYHRYNVPRDNNADIKLFYLFYHSSSRLENREMNCQNEKVPLCKPNPQVFFNSKHTRGKLPLCVFIKRQQQFKGCMISANDKHITGSLLLDLQMWQPSWTPSCCWL